MSDPLRAQLIEAREADFYADQLASSTTITAYANSSNAIASDMDHRVKSYKKMYKKLAESFKYVSDRAKCSKGMKEADQLKLQIKQFDEILTKLRDLRVEDRQALAEIMDNFDSIVKHSEDIVTAFRRTMKYKEELHEYYVEQIGELVDKMQMRIYKLESPPKYSRKIVTYWDQLVELMVFHWIPYSTALGKIPVLCLTCKLLCNCNKENFNEENMVDLRGIFCTADEVYFDSMKEGLAKNIYKVECQGWDTEDLMKKFEKELLPFINIPGNRKKKAAYHKCTDAEDRKDSQNQRRRSNSRAGAKPGSAILREHQTPPPKKIINEQNSRTEVKNSNISLRNKGQKLILSGKKGLGNTNQSKNVSNDTSPLSSFYSGTKGKPQKQAINKKSNNSIENELDDDQGSKGKRRKIQEESEGEGNESEEQCTSTHVHAYKYRDRIEMTAEHFKKFKTVRVFFNENKQRQFITYNVEELESIIFFFEDPDN